MCQRQVSRVGNQEGQQIAAHSVFRASGHASELLGELDHLAVLDFAVPLSAFEEQRASAKIVRVVSLVVQHIEFLDFIDQTFKRALSSRLESCAKFELFVIDKTARSWVDLQAGASVHEFHTVFPVVEDERFKNPDLWNRLDFDYSLGDNTKVTLAAHEQVMNVRTVRHARPVCQPLVGSLAGDHRDVLNDIFDISICILLHSGSPGRNPASECGELHGVWLVT